MCKSTLKPKEETTEGDDVKEIKENVAEILDKVSKLTDTQPQKAPEPKKNADPPKASNSILAFFDKFNDPE